MENVEAGKAGGVVPTPQGEGGLTLSRDQRLHLEALGGLISGLIDVAAGLEGIATVLEEMESNRDVVDAEARCKYMPGVFVNLLSGLKVLASQLYSDHGYIWDHYAKVTKPDSDE